MGYCGYQEELLHHHKCPTTSYSKTACSVFRCTGGFVIALIPNGKGVRMMLSTEYRESIERRFHAFCKAVLHNEACNYYRERKHRTQREISFGYLQEQIGALLGKPRTTVNYQKNAALKQLRTEMEKMNDEEQQIQPCSL